MASEACRQSSESLMPHRLIDLICEGVPHDHKRQLHGARSGNVGGGPVFAQCNVC